MQVDDRARIRVGADLLRVGEVAASIERFGDRYLRRLFTDHELASSHGAPERLAARFAAKEATVKVLRPADAQPDWRSIEVRRDASGACHLALSGTAAAMAAAAGITDLAVSLTHERDLAAAVVVAIVEEDAAA
ncbi:MAG: Holo-[acyl-carrier-protein] synthase [Actinomycetia bacterium]|nr:Holo-[acyl-carrier-protein] synthase [Actinomycetes bacterium]